MMHLNVLNIYTVTEETDYLERYQNIWGELLSSRHEGLFDC